MTSVPITLIQLLAVFGALIVAGIPVVLAGSCPGCPACRSREPAPKGPGDRLHGRRRGWRYVAEALRQSGPADLAALRREF